MFYRLSNYGTNLDEKSIWISYIGHSLSPRNIFRFYKSQSSMFESFFIQSIHIVGRKSYFYPETFFLGTTCFIVFKESSFNEFVFSQCKSRCPSDKLCIVRFWSTKFERDFKNILVKFQRCLYVSDVENGVSERNHREEG
jgi:hypothetical protein